MLKEMLQKSLCLLVVLLSSGCTALLFDPIENNITPVRHIEAASIDSLVISELADVPTPIRKPTIAVYATGFTDQTGQRLSNSMYASFSSAVTQAPSAYLLKALKDAGSNNNGFFVVVERIGIDNLTKERQIIRSGREQNNDNNKLNTLLFAGLLIEGTVVSYEANETSGGAGVRYLGIGHTKAYRTDSITIQLRVISVSTGQVLIEKLVTKTILSVSLSNDVFRFIEAGTELVEIESGVVRNESGSLALRSAIETGVLGIIKEGREAGYWSY
jgi:curli production assembly/transport component CsgG